MTLVRLLKHLLIPGWWAHRVLRRPDRAAIRNAIAASEQRHRGELCFAIEGAMPFRSLLAGDSARQRAERLFETLGVGNTREASGILIYVQLIDRRVEVLADRGINDQVRQAEWDRLCRQMESAFKQRAWRRGILEAIDGATAMLELVFPARGDNPNELEDGPHFL